MPDKVSGWEMVSLSDPVTVRGLLKYRAEFDPTWRIEERSWIESGFDIANVSEDIHLTYIELQEVMDETRFTMRQKEILEYYQDGFSEEWISKELNLEVEKLEKAIDRICERISEAKKDLWLEEFIRWNKVKVQTNYKECSKCRKFLPVDSKYFANRQDTFDGFMYICRKCMK